MKREDQPFLEAELAFSETASKDLRFGKSYREEQLRNVRRLQRILGIEGTNYNGGT